VIWIKISEQGLFT